LLAYRNFLRYKSSFIINNRVKSP